MKEVKFKIPIWASAEYLEDFSSDNFYYYKLNRLDYDCNFRNNNIVEEIYHENGDYFDYNLGHFENGIFVTIFSWNSEYGADSIFL